MEEAEVVTFWGWVVHRRPEGWGGGGCPGILCRIGVVGVVFDRAI